MGAAILLAPTLLGCDNLEKISDSDTDNERTEKAERNVKRIEGDIKKQLSYFNDLAKKHFQSGSINQDLLNKILVGNLKDDDFSSEDSRDALNEIYNSGKTLAELFDKLYENYKILNRTSEVDEKIKEMVEFYAGSKLPEAKIEVSSSSNNGSMSSHSSGGSNFWFWYWYHQTLVNNNLATANAARSYSSNYVRSYTPYVSHVNRNVGSTASTRPVNGPSSSMGGRTSSSTSVPSVGARGGSIGSPGSSSAS